MSVIIHDAAVREAALNPGQSFIVEAPAGSGKTELLVQRYLSLLAYAVKNPEEIIAITFTKKAAHEMRMRVIHALMHAAEQKESVLQKSVTVQLAEKVLARDRQENWQLMANPNRLAIQTIDAFCMRLTQKMPMLSGLGGDAQISAIPEVIYQKSIKAVLDTLNDDVPWRQALIHVFTHFDNQYDTIENVFIDMLKRRDQWLPYMMDLRSPHVLRQQFETHLSKIMIDLMVRINQVLPHELAHHLVPLARYAADNVEADSTIKACQDVLSWPAATLADLPVWHGLLELLLTQQGDYRKQVNKNTGFPPGHDAKKIMQALLENIQGNETLRFALVALRDAPPCAYKDSSWEFLQALFTLLPIMAAQLNLTFAQQGQVDFIEIATRALQALGEDDAPTDLALVLDYQLQHILVDEFQDTSMTQFRLLEKIVRGWLPDDGRTLFLVGDPMQSIYRFRQANVGLFLQAKYHGIGGVYLQPCTLTMNFRSTPLLIEWMNRIMPAIMPKVAHIASGAIAFTAAIPAREAHIHSQVKTHLSSDAQSEADTLVQQIEEIKAQHPNWSMAVLVRSRSHLRALLPTLKNAQIPYQAVEIEPLAKQRCISDLVALTRALLHFHDKVAWLAVLRAPWCGMALAELELITMFDREASLWQVINDEACLAQLSSAARTRVTRLTQALMPTLMARQRLSLAQWVESAAIALGAMHVIAEPERANVESFYQLLHFLEQEYRVVDGFILEQHLEGLYSNQVEADNAAVQIMTIHKAKGLEFDVVFLPGLSRRPAVNTAPLLRHVEQTLEEETQWLLAPVHAKTAEPDGVYQYLARLEKQQQDYEVQRLLYVALTRAKQQLYLFAHQDKEGKPAPGSLLALLWSHLPAQDLVFTQETRAVQAEALAQLTRLPQDWRLPAPWQDWLQAQAINPAVIENKVDESVYTADYLMHRYMGTLLHRILKYVAEHAVNWDRATIENILRPRWRVQLMTLGVLHSEIDKALDLLTQAVMNILTDERGQWVLFAHEHAVCEYALHASIKGVHKSVVIDRTFVDNQGVRWIIDYKSSAPVDEPLGIFLQRDQLVHQAQLNTYAQIMRQVENRKIRLGLYYPLVCGWYEWEYV